MIGKISFSKIPINIDNNINFEHNNFTLVYTGCDLVYTSYHCRSD